MYYAGGNAHVKLSMICVADRKGRRVNRATVLSGVKGFRAGLGWWALRGFVAALESSGITAWVAELLKGLAVKVPMNPNRVRLIADRVDAALLAELLRVGHCRRCTYLRRRPDSGGWSWGCGGNWCASVLR